MCNAATVIQKYSCIAAKDVTLYFRVPPPAPLGTLLPGLYAVLVKMTQRNELLFFFTVKPG